MTTILAYISYVYKVKMNRVKGTKLIDYEINSRRLNGSVLIYLPSEGSGDANLIVSELRPPLRNMVSWLAVFTVYMSRLLFVGCTTYVAYSIIH